MSSLATRILEAQAEAEEEVKAIPEMSTLYLNLEGHSHLTRVEITRNILAFRLSFYKGDDLVTPETVYPEGLNKDLASHRTDCGFKDLPLDGATAILYSLREDIRDAAFQAKFEAALELGSDQTGGIDRYATMCEPGYASSDPNCKGYLIANWNHVDAELAQWLEDEGYDSGHWSDEWTSCSECNGLIRIQGDSYSWKMYGQENPEVGFTCGDCLKKDIPAYLEGKSNKGVVLDVDPAEHGYVLVNEERNHFENGWHPGQDADPKEMSKLMRLNGIHRFLWMINSVGQFDTQFTLYIHKEIEGELTRLRGILGIA